MTHLGIFHSSAPISANGLDQVVAAHTRLSMVDGQAGQLVIAGVDVEHPPGDEAFCNAAARLLAAAGSTLTAATLRDQVVAKVRARATQAAHAKRGVSSSPSEPFDVIRQAIAGVASTGDDQGDLVAIVATYLAQLQALAPTQVALLASVFAGTPEPDSLQEAKRIALTTYLATVMDHGLNASTFAARVVASTGADLVSAVLAGLSALKGPLHGGAPGPVLDMLDAIATPDHATAWLAAELAAGQRIMGMGHRIYKVRDPRAAVFEAALAKLSAAGVATPRLPLARAVEQAAVSLLKQAKPGQALQTNVEFYTAVLLDTLGFDRQLFTPLFGFGRMIGWAAHVLEQRACGRLIRPGSQYVGALPAGTT